MQRKGLIESICKKTISLYYSPLFPDKGCSVKRSNKRKGKNIQTKNKEKGQHAESSLMGVKLGRTWGKSEMQDRQEKEGVHSRTRITVCFSHIFGMPVWETRACIQPVQAAAGHAALV